MCEKQYTIKDIIQRFDKLEQHIDKLEQQLKQRTVVKKAYTISEFAKAYNMTELKTRELDRKSVV